MRPITNEKRKIIIEAKKRGESEKDIMEWVEGVSRSSISKIWKRFRETGSYLPKPYTGNNRKITKEQTELIRETIREIPDITLLELIDKLDLNVSESGLSKHLKKMGLTYKKRHSIQMGKKEKI